MPGEEEDVYKLQGNKWRKINLQRPGEEGRETIGKEDR